jgi:hypothetical protein
MNRVLIGFKRHMIPVPWALFRRIVPRRASQSRRVVGPLPDDHRRVHHYVVRELPRLGRPMPPELVAEALALPLADVVSILDDLERRKIFLFRPGGRDVAWAYPVTVEPTPHHLGSSSGEQLYAA